MSSPTWCCPLQHILSPEHCLCSLYEKHSYKTNQTDSLQMETKAQIQLRFHLICCLSSDSMWSHPEIPHKPHLLSTWPCSHATARSAQRQQGSPKRSAKANKSRCRRNKRHGRWAWCNAVYTVCRGRLGKESTEAVITLWDGMALSRMSIASAWMCAVMISSRWWFTWWYLIACHHLTCRTSCAVLIRTEYQRGILHVIVLVFCFFQSYVL